MSTWTPRFEAKGDTIYDREHPEYASATHWVARCRDAASAARIADEMNKWDVHQKMTNEELNQSFHPENAR